MKPVARDPDNLISSSFQSVERKSSLLMKLVFIPHAFSFFFLNNLSYFFIHLHVSDIKILIFSFSLSLSLWILFCCPLARFHSTLKGSLKSSRVPQCFHQHPTHCQHFLCTALTLFCSVICCPISLNLTSLLLLLLFLIFWFCFEGGVWWCWSCYHS